jgi:hypothetical protein
MIVFIPMGKIAVAVIVITLKNTTPSKQPGPQETAVSKR